MSLDTMQACVKMRGQNGRIVFGEQTKLALTLQYSGNLAMINASSTLRQTLLVVQGLVNTSAPETLFMLNHIAVPHYSVAVQSVEDIQKAIRFANEKDLYLVVKNTGHSQLSGSL